MSEFKHIVKRLKNRELDRTKQRFIVTIDSPTNAKLQLEQLLAEEVRCEYINSCTIQEVQEATEPTIEQRMNEMKEADRVSGEHAGATDEHYRKWATEEWKANHADYLTFV